MWVQILRFLGFCAVFSLSFTQASAAPTDYKEVDRFKFSDDGSWDYLTIDAQARRLYIARSNRIQVLNVDTGKQVGEVMGLNGAHGVALLKEQGVGFASSGKSGEVVVFDLEGLKVRKRIAAGENPDAIIYDAPSNSVLAFNGRSKTMTAIDPAQMKVSSMLPLPGKPEFAVSDGAGLVFVNIEDKNQLLAIDPRAGKITQTYDLKPCEEPTGLSMDLQSKRLIIGCGNRVALIFDAHAGKVTQTFKVGSGVDATAFDPSRKLAFVSAGEGSLTILAEEDSGFRVEQVVTTVKSARTLAVDALTGQVFLPIARFKPQTHERPSVIPNTFEVLVEGTSRPHAIGLHSRHSLGPESLDKKLH